MQAKTRTEYPLCTRSALPAVPCRVSRPFPPQGWRNLHRAVIAEILQEDVGERRPRQVKRGVKRKQSRYPVRNRSDTSKKAERTLEIVR